VTDIATRDQHRAIYRRWRAQRFSELIGQDAIVTTLRNAVRLGRVGHAYLFAGPRGTGKTSTARILAKAINCTSPIDGEPDDTCVACVAIREGRALDLVEIDAASNRGIDQIRDLREKVRYAPTDLQRKVYILDEAHQITRDGWAALLKTLEEPPEHVVFMFASTDPQDIPATILSRVQRFDFRRLRTSDIAAKLDRILADSGREADADAVELVARLAAGGMRDAESMLDQLLTSSDDRLTADGVRDLLGLADEASVTGFVAALVDGDAAGGIAILDELEDRGRDLRTFGEQVIDALRAAIAARLADPGSSRGAGAATLAGLAAAARRLAGTDLHRDRVGGARLALELALLLPLPDLRATSPVSRSTSPDAAPPKPDAGASPDLGESAAEASPAPSESAPATRPSSRRPAAPEAEPAAASATPRAEPAAVPVAPATEPAATPITRPPEPVAAGVTSSPAADGTTRATADTTADAGTADTGTADTGTADTGTADTGTADTGTADTGTADTGTADTGTADTGTADTEIARVRARWTEILATISRNPAARPLIEACRPIAVEGRVIVLGFPEDKAFLATALERRRSVLEQGISQVLGASYGVRCVATNVEDLPDFEAGADEESRALLDQARRIFVGEATDVGEVS
jgi:DNA polymerase-3 subunit gamma/tau